MLRSGCLFIAMVLLGAAWLPQAAEAQRHFRISHQWSADIDARDRAARVFATEVQKRVPSISFSIHPKSELGIKPIEQFDALVDGRLDLAIYPLFYGTKKVPEFSIGLLPGVPANTELAGLLKGSEFEEKLQALAMEKGVRILTWWWLGGGIASRSQFIGGPETAKGLPIRTGDKAFDLMIQAAGGHTPSMPSTEIASRMASGELEAALTSYESFVSFRIYEHAKYATFGGYGIWTSFQPLLMSRAVWESLTPEEQQAFEEAAAISDAYFVETQLDALKTAVDTFRKAGAQVRELTYDEYENWLRVAKESSWEEYQKISPVAEELFASMLRSFIASDRREAGTLDSDEDSQPVNAPRPQPASKAAGQARSVAQPQTILPLKPSE